MSPNNLKRQLHAIPVPPELRQRSQSGIERAMLEQQENNRRKSNRVKRRVGALIAALVLLFLSADLLNHNYVWAGIQRALQFVPGIGIVKEENSPRERYILNRPISLDVGKGSITITGILSDEEMTYITMMGENAPRAEKVRLVNAQGVEYTLKSSTASWSSSEWTSGFWYKGKLDASGNMKLVFDSEPRIEVPLTLTRAATYSSYLEMGETATVNGVSITAIPDAIGEKARISLVARHSKDFYITDYGISGVYMHEESQKLSVVDDIGQKLAIETIRAVSSPQSEFYFNLSDKARNRYTLTLPEISVTYNSEVSIKIPTEEQEHMNQVFEIAGFPVTITKIEKVQKNGLRMYLDFHYDEKAAASLYSLNLDGISSAARLNEQTGAMEYIEFEVEPGKGKIKIKLNKPGVVLRGPWRFDLRGLTLQQE